MFCNYCLIITIIVLLGQWITEKKFVTSMLLLVVVLFWIFSTKQSMFSLEIVPLWVAFLYFLYHFAFCGEILFGLGVCSHPHALCSSFPDLLLAVRWTFSCPHMIVISCTVLLGIWGMILHYFPDMFSQVSLYSIPLILNFKNCIFFLFFQVSFILFSSCLNFFLQALIIFMAWSILTVFLWRYFFRFPFYYFKSLRLRRDFGFVCWPSLLSCCVNHGWEAIVLSEDALWPELWVSPIEGFDLLLPRAPGK